MQLSDELKFPKERKIVKSESQNLDLSLMLPTRYLLIYLDQQPADTLSLENQLQYNM